MPSSCPFEVKACSLNDCPCLSLYVNFSPSSFLPPPHFTATPVLGSLMGSLDAYYSDNSFGAEWDLLLWSSSLWRWSPREGRLGRKAFTVIFSSTGGRGRMGVIFLLLLASGCLPLDWPPFPDVVIVLQPSWGPPSAGRHFSSGRSELNSCWEQLGLYDCCQWETTGYVWVYQASLKNSRDLIIQGNTRCYGRPTP